MFGYLNVDKNSAEDKEKGLFGTFMCSLCLSTKRLFGNIKRLSVSNDINLFNVLFHSFLNEEVKVEMGKCVLSPFKDRPLIHPNALTDKLACYNMILIYYNLADDLLDERSPVKRIVFASFKKSIGVAKEKELGFYNAVKDEYEKLVALEKNDCCVLDEVCHPFSEISRKLAVCALGDRCTPRIEELCYNLGKWVYLIDALDDLQKDLNKKMYNPILKCFGYDGESVNRFVKKNRNELDFVFYTALYKIAQCFNDMGLEKYVCVLKSVFHKSLRRKTEDVFGRYN